jgi:hypothetical protein
MNVRFYPRPRLITRLAVWGVLLLYVGVFSPLGLAMTAALGALDREHRLMVEPGTESFRVVLHHASPGELHRHGLVARAFAAFAQKDNAANTDHVLQFAAPSSLLQKLQSELVSIAGVPTSLNIWSLRERLLASVPTHAPPAEGGPLSFLRSTQLLI